MAILNIWASFFRFRSAKLPLPPPPQYFAQLRYWLINIQQLREIEGNDSFCADQKIIPPKVDDHVVFENHLLENFLTWYINLWPKCSLLTKVNLILIKLGRRSTGKDGFCTPSFPSHLEFIVRFSKARLIVTWHVFLDYADAILGFHRCR